MLYVELEAESCVQNNSQILNAKLGRDGALFHDEGDVLHLLPARKEHNLCFSGQLVSLVVGQLVASVF